jgi:Possible lysine decarboxylase
MELAKPGFTVMTGGGRASWKRPIVAPRKSAGGRSAAISSYRKSKNSYAFIGLPGGFGTLDEIFETATLIQTAKISRFPLVLIVSEFWRPLLEFLSQHLVKEKTIEHADVDRLIVTDSPRVAVALITEVAMGQFGLSYDSRIKRRWYLGERHRSQVSLSSSPSGR